MNYSIVDEHGEVVGKFKNLDLFAAELALTRCLNNGINCYLEEDC